MNVVGIRLLGLPLVSTFFTFVAAGTSPEVLCDGQQATIVGTSGPDEIQGTDGPDVIASLGGNDSVQGGAGDDRICGGAEDDRLFGNLGADRLFGGLDRSGETTADVLSGGRGDDFFDTGSGDGFDVVTYKDADGAILVDAAAGLITGEQSGTDTLGYYEGVRGSPFADTFLGRQATTSWR